MDVVKPTYSRSAALLLVIAMAPVCGRFTSAQETPPRTIEFSRHIQPILSGNCFHCHGPDELERQAGLRLDTEAGALATLDSGGAAIVRGDASASELIRRVTSEDESLLMPPPDSGYKLTSAQKDLLVRWVTEGAPWQNHWSFIPPTRPPLPSVWHPGWPRVAWDAFVLQRLQQEGLEPSPETDKEALLRRVTLDLTGLPPTIEEVDAYLRDSSSAAYEKVVDRLLASPRYGERMATDWLDAARYADTNGYQSDGVRYMWRWRDEVIAALNRNMPFDQFTIEQLAGDMLPDATLEQKIASGFNRNHRGNAEGGIIPEEYAVEYVADRVDTTSTVWLGLTIGCARCHDHKFDPITQKEFYQLFALFNNVPERGRAVKYGNSDPQIKSPTELQQAELRQLDAQLAEVRTRLLKLQPLIVEAQAEWERIFDFPTSEDWSPRNELLLHLPLDRSTDNLCEAAPATTTSHGSIAFPAGPIGGSAEFSGEEFVDLGDIANFGYFDAFSISFWIQPRDTEGVVLGRMAEGADTSGYNVQLDRGKLQLNLVVRWLDDALRVETADPLVTNRWQHVVATYDGSRVAAGVRIYVDGRPVRLRVLCDELNQDFVTQQPLVVGAGGPGPRYSGRLDELRVYSRALSAAEAEVLATLSSIGAIAALPGTARTAVQSRKLAACFLDRHAPPAIDDVRSELLQLEQQKLELEQSIPTTMVMQELPERRPTFMLSRGEYDKPTDDVLPGVPANLKWPGQPPIRNRLDFARWLVARENPLTARVTVNRIWQLYFGQGLVKTANDFGSQGERPSHPELLDYLAADFKASGWNLKHLHKSIVMSATYRQSTQVSPELAQRDPDNRLLARGPRQRLSAEMVRDQALFVSGLLAEQLGGPSVLPYQPAGLWKELGDAIYTQDHGESLYRRSLYTFWKRTVAPPTMITFDAAGRESCRVLHTRTNTPLQALTLLNEVTVVEAARKLAERMLRGGVTPEERLMFAFRVVLARRPTSAELRILNAGLSRHLEHYREQPKAAEQLIVVGESPRDEKLDAAELAAYTATANLILNLDETITKP
jgi:hypothetical protein